MDNYDFVPSNTMALSSFDVLKMDGIEDPLIDVNKLATLDLDESYTTQAINFIKESTVEFTDAKIKFYHALTESTSEGVVLESFSDFFTAAKDIIAKFLKFIKSLFQRFINTLMNLVHSDSYITKNKKKFTDFKDGVDDFKMNIYIYTITPDIPVANTVLDFAGVFEDMKPDTGKAISTQSVRDSISVDNTDLYDKFRGACIGQDVQIYSNEYATELFKQYRDQMLDTDETEITRSMVLKSLDRFLNYNTYKKTVAHDQSQIERAYKQLQDQVKQVAKRNGDLNVTAFLNQIPDSTGISSVSPSDTNNGLTMSGELMTQIDLYIKNKVDIIQECSNIHTLAFASKLDAMKSCYKQDRAILYGALNRISRTDAAREV